MTNRCVPCAFQYYQETGDLGRAIRKSGASSSFVYGGTSMCENHFVEEVLIVEQAIAAKKAEESKE